MQYYWFWLLKNQVRNNPRRQASFLQYFKLQLKEWKFLEENDIIEDDKLVQWIKKLFKIYKVQVNTLSDYMQELGYEKELIKYVLISIYEVRDVQL